MDKVITRLTIILVTIYFLVSYILALFGLDILTNSYVVLFESCVVAYTFYSGKFHCKYMRWTALSILTVEIINQTDYYFDYIPVSVFNIIPISILALGIATSVTLAIRHFVIVSRIRKSRNAR
jgi:hypothetical protein